MSYRSPASVAMFLNRCGWKVRQIAGRRIWYKGRAGAEIVARNMAEAEQMEYTLRRTMPQSVFMYGQEIAEVLGALPPTPKVRPLTVAGWGFTMPSGELDADFCTTKESAQSTMCFAANRTSGKRSANCVCSPADDKAAHAEGWRVVPVVLTRR